MTTNAQSLHFQHASWLALGDSYTIGEGVMPEERWPTQLTQRYQFLPPTYLAKTGWTTQDLLRAIAASRLATRYNWVSVQIGVNDQYDGVDVSTYRNRLADIIDVALSRVTNPNCVLVLSIPDYSVTPFAQSRELAGAAEAVALFNTVGCEIATSKQVTYCDITPLSQQAAHDLTLLAEDGLHPSGLMYRMWVEKLIQEVSIQ